MNKLITVGLSPQKTLSKGVSKVLLSLILFFFAGTFLSCTEEDIQTFVFAPLVAYAQYTIPAFVLIVFTLIIGVSEWVSKVDEVDRKNAEYRKANPHPRPLREIILESLEEYNAPFLPVDNVDDNKD